MSDNVQKSESVLDIHPGDFYEDCSYHPCVCVEVNYDEKEIWGISLIDGSQPRSCDLENCGVRKLSIDVVWDIKKNGPKELTKIEEISVDNRWW